MMEAESISGESLTCMIEFQDGVLQERKALLVSSVHVQHCSGGRRGAHGAILRLELEHFVPVNVETLYAFQRVQHGGRL